MNTENEILEFAAKTMQALYDPRFLNYEVAYGTVCLELGAKRGDITSYWNPLESDEDAFRLAIDLGIVMHPLCFDDYSNPFVGCFAYNADGVEISSARCEIRNDKYKATRRAITLVAAELGKLQK